MFISQFINYHLTEIKFWILSLVSPDQSGVACLRSQIRMASERSACQLQIIWISKTSQPKIGVQQNQRHSIVLLIRLETLEFCHNKLKVLYYILHTI